MQGVVKTAMLRDGSVWVLASPDHLSHLAAAHAATLPRLHAAVLAAFGAGEGGSGVQPADFQVRGPGGQGRQGRPTGGPGSCGPFSASPLGT